MIIIIRRFPSLSSLDGMLPGAVGMSPILIPIKAK
jgi:hypothetical protein